MQEELLESHPIYGETAPALLPVLRIPLGGPALLASLLPGAPAPTRTHLSSAETTRLSGHHAWILAGHGAGAVTCPRSERCLSRCRTHPRSFRCRREIQIPAEMTRAWCRLAGRQS